MEKHYLENMGEITYVYGVDLEEHKTVIEKQQKRIAELEKQLAEKDCRIEELEGQFAYECECNKQLVELQKQLAEKDKEIERLKNLFELNNEVVINQGKEMFDLRVQVLQQKQNQIQLAIQELEKVKNKCNGMYELWLDSNYRENMYDNEDIAGAFEDISVFANDLIRKLKGE